MKIGITGTREGMNDRQLMEVWEYLRFKYVIGAEFHHGDCAGVDVEAAALAKDIGYKIVCHPPKSKYMQGFFGGEEMREPKGYLQRDRNIVDETDELMVVPLQDSWQPNGGTWYTHDYAVKTNKPLKVFWPCS